MEKDVSYIFEALVQHQLHMNLIDLKLYSTIEILLRYSIIRYLEIFKSFQYEKVVDPTCQ